MISSRISRRKLLELGAAAVAAPAIAAVVNAAPAQAAEGDGPHSKLKVDADWPKPLPDVLRPGESFRRTWVTGDVAGHAVDSRDHVFTVNRRDLTGTERAVATPSPAIIEFDKKGNVVNGFPEGEPRPMPDPFLPDGLHGLFVDHEDNVWIGGNGDAIVQKYSHDGRWLMTIGEKRHFDSTDGTAAGTALNASTRLLNRPSDIAVDPANNDIYISDGYGNHRVVVFNSHGVFQRQWGSAGTLAEAIAGAPGKFRGTVHGINLSNEGLVYVNDRAGDRIQVFTKRGVFVRNIWTNNGIAIGATGSGAGSAWDLAFSKDKKQKFIYSTDGNQQINSTIDHKTGETVAVMGRPGHMAAEFTFLHTVAVDSTGNLYTAETIGGRRLQRFQHG